MTQMKLHPGGGGVGRPVLDAKVKRRQLSVYRFHRIVSRNGPEKNIPCVEDSDRPENIAES
jgi:hypothetical protein